jgi:hypothetical protein
MKALVKFYNHLETGLQHYTMQTSAVFKFPGKPAKPGGQFGKSSCLLPLNGEQLRGGLDVSELTTSCSL